MNCRVLQVCGKSYNTDSQALSLSLVYSRETELSLSWISEREKCQIFYFLFHFFLRTKCLFYVCISRHHFKKKRLFQEILWKFLFLLRTKIPVKNSFHQCGIFFLISLEVLWLKIRPNKRSDRTVYHILDKPIQNGKSVGKSNYSRKCTVVDQTLLHII